MRVVAAIPVAGLLAGCGLGLYSADGSAFIPLFFLIVSAAGVVHAARGDRELLLATAIAAGFCSGGMLLARAAWRDAWRPTLRVAFESIARGERSDARRAGGTVPRPDAEDAASVVFVGELRSDASATEGGGVSLPIAVRWIGRAGSLRHGLDIAANPVDGGVLLTVVGALAQAQAREWRAGRTVRAAAQIHRPARYLDPGVPDQERALARRGISLVGSVKSGALVEVVSRGHPIAEAAARVRAFARRAIRDAVGRWSVRSAGIVTAIVIGDRSGLDPDVERQLQEAGTYHVIAISGGNIAILAGLTLLGFRVAGVLGRAAMLSAVSGLAAYGYLVGGGASVDRATLMAVIYFLGRAIDLRGPTLNILALVAGLLVVRDPLAVADPAFLLTFGATTAILVVAQALSMSGPSRLAASIAAMFVASLAAEIALFPVGAALFSRVTVAGLGLNFLAIPLMAVAQIAGMMVVPLSAASPLLALAAGWIAHLGAEGLVRSAGLVRLMPIVTWRVAAPSAAAIATYYAALVAAWFLWHSRHHITGSRERPAIRVLRVGSVAVACLAGGWMLFEPWTVVAARGDGRLHITFIDVGQGDSALVVFPRGASLLIDAGGATGGGPFDIGDRVVAPVVRERGLRRLGTIAVTHGDADHIGGALSSLLEFRPREVWEGISVPSFGPLQRLASAASSVGAQWRNVRDADVTRIDGVAVVVRHPGPPDWERQRIRNDDSIVIEILWRDVSVVLTGDIGREVEEQIAPRFASVPLRIVKVPHHGSQTSSSDVFIRTLAPRVAVVSVGRRNNFGHPAPAVLDRYRQAGTEIFRTDRDGAVTVDTDGRSLDVHTFTGRRLTLTSPESRRHEGTKS